MHQLVKSDFNGVGKVLAEAKSKVGSPFRGVGKRSFITLTFKPKDDGSLPLGIEFYAETVVSPTPGDPDMGFTHDDLKVYRGVAIYLMDDTEGGKHTNGEIISFDTFLDRYISHDEARTPIELCMDRLEAEAAVQQSFFDKLNNIWQERDIHRQQLYDKQVH